MRPDFYTLVIALHVIAAFQQAYAQGSYNPSSSNNSNFTANKNLPGDVSAEWYTQAVAGIKDLQDKFYEHLTEGAYQVANSTHKLQFHIHPAGYKARTMHQGLTNEAWEVGFNLQGIGRNGSFWHPHRRYNVSHAAKELRYHFDNVQVEYLNGRDGLRQNFMVYKKMTGKGKLAVTLQLETNLKASLSSDNKLAFYANNNSIVLTYEDLKVWDAKQRTLPATMHLKNNVLTIEVDDSEAAYPITIDPLNKTPEWSTSVEGVIANTLSQAQLNAALYGFNVTGVGDVNGDGFGDVAISAPALTDVFSGNHTLVGVGAVFVYYGSASGLATTPAKTLQPNTAVAGALFGFSVDAGDVTGDGINDIIIGAPLDSYSTTAGPLGLGATVTAGKVYIYPGTNLANPNPSNFLEVKLQGSGLFNILTNINIKALFGFSVAATDDLNGDHKADLIVGAPAYLGTSLLSVQSGSAFVYYSNNLGTSSPAQLQVPNTNVLGLLSLPLANVRGLLYGFSVDGVGDYNNDGYSDVVVGAPAGVDLSTLDGLLTGQVLGGSAYVYLGNGSGINTSIGAKLQSSPSGLLGNAANLFGLKVKGIRGVNGARTGGILIGAPVGGLAPNLLNLTIQTGNVHVFKKKTSTPSGAVISDQVIESPRSTSVLNVLNTLRTNVLFGTGIDNAYDVNCDGAGDLVIGEPLSSGATLLQLQTNAVGGAAYVFLGDGTGGYNAAPGYTVSATHGSDFMSVNAVSMFGYSVAGVRNVRGAGTSARVLVGAPSGALDFDNSLLNLGSTLGTLFDFVAQDNGLGKTFLSNTRLCAIDNILPLTLLAFDGRLNNGMIDLLWKTSEEQEVSHYEVQKSTDGIHFQTIGKVNALTNSRNNNYSFTDKNPASGINFYRLKMVDIGQTAKLSRQIRFRVDDNNRSIVVSPNPTPADIRVQFNGVVNNMYRLELRNSVGQLVQTKRVNITRYGQSENLIRSASMTPGIYFLLVYDKNNSITSYDRVIVQ